MRYFIGFLLLLFACGGSGNETSFEDLRQIATALDPIKAGYLAYARALVHWHQEHEFCGVCGKATKSGRAGHQRTCLNPECNKSHFPRTDPAVIMLVTHPTEDKCLLGHNKKFQQPIIFA